MLEGKAVNAYKAFNHCKLMVMICKEAMTGTHYKCPVCNWTQFVDC